MKLVSILTLIFLIIHLPLFSQNSSGTGFLISENGYIVTCYHVVENSSQIEIRGLNGDFKSKYSAKLIAKDIKNDLAILKVNCKLNSPIYYSLSWNLKEVGNEVFTLGYPLLNSMGEEIKLTNGIVSSKSGFRGDQSSYQISTPIQPGNSGGPLFDKNGYVIGIISAKHKNADNVGYAVKSNILKNLIQTSSLNIKLNSNHILHQKKLADQVKLAKKDILIVEVYESSFSSNSHKNNNLIKISTIADAKMREKPEVFSNIINIIPKDNLIEIVGLEGDYWKIFYKGKIGYANTMYFEKNITTKVLFEQAKFAKMPSEYKDNFEIAITTSQAKLRIDPHPLSKVISTITKEEVIYIIDYQDGYWKVYYNGNIGFLADGMYFDVTYPMMRFKN